MKDNNDRKARETALAYSEQHYRTLGQKFPNGTVLLFDHELRYTLADGAGLAAVGLSKELLEGKTICEVFPPEICEILEPIYRQALAGEVTTREIPYADNTYLLYTVPVKNEQGEILGGMTASQDISDRKQAERELYQLKEEQEVRVQERTAELIHANEQLQREIAVRLEAEKGLYESQVCLKLINTISTGITSGMQPMQVIERTVKQLSQHFKQLRVAYCTIDKQGILTVMQALNPPGMPPLQGLVADLKAAPEYLNALRRNQPQIIADVSTDIKLAPLCSAWVARGTKAVLDVPLYSDTDGLVGLLCFDSPKPRQWSSYEVATLIEIADYLSVTLKEAQAQQDRARAEVALRESEERYRLLVELSPETILVQSEGKIAYINPAGIKLLGTTASEELIGRPLLDRVHPNYREFVQKQIQQVQEEAQQAPLAEIQMVRIDGQVIDVELTGVRIVYQGQLAVQVLIRDITERKRTQEALQKYTAQAWDLYNNAPCGYHSLDENGTFASINNTELQWLGYSKDEIIGKLKFTDILTPETSKTFQENFLLFKERGWINDMEFQLVRKDGSILPVILSATAITDEEGRFFATRSTVFDITERKQAESELQAQAQLLDLAHDTIMVRDMSDRIMFWNQGAVEMYGYTVAEALGQNARILLQTQFSQPLKDIEAQLLSSGHWEGELVHTRRDRSRIVVATRWALQRDEYGIPVKILEINNDITERVQAEQELRESESLIRALYQVTANLKLSFNQRLDNLLEIGCQYFGLDFGIVAQVKGDFSEVIAARSPDNLLKVGDVYDVNQTFCLEVSKQEKPFSVQQASNSEWREHPGYTIFQRETYIGTKILVQGDIYGILSFSSCMTRPRNFRDLDKELLKLMAQWIGSEIERYSADQALERLQHHNELILNSAGEGICGVNSQGNITFVNPAAAKMLGYTVEELINQPIYATLSQSKEEETPQTLDKAFLHAVLKDGTVQHFKDQVFWRKDGSSFPVECMVTPMQERKAREQGSRGVEEQFSALPIVGAVVTFRDITERQAIERMKDEFVSVVSHELRTPLTAIRGSLGLIAGGLLTSQPQKAQRMLEIAAGNTDRLTRLINDILDIERMESGKVQMEKEVCKVYDLMVQTADDMQTMAEKAGVTLVVAPMEAQMRVDRDRIIQVLTNLISNAIKFSPPNTKVEIIAELQEAGEQESKGKSKSTLSCVPVPVSDNSKQILFKVKDQGRGIPEDKLESIFGRFQQVNASDSRDKGGTGLGLAICRSIVQQHGGYIWVESKLGEGSTFCFTLPVLQMSRGAEEQFCLSAPQPPLVLLCDDETSIHVPVKILLESRGYRVVAVASGEEAIKQAAELQPSVILLDLLMPGMNGWETMAVLKEQPNTKNIPIIIFSAWASQEDKSSHPEVVNWLSKPLTEEALFESIKQSLKQRDQVTRVLVVEDDPDLARVLTTMFERHGIEAYHAQTGREAIHLSQQVLPDLLLLDLVLPEGDGYTVVEWLRLHDYLHEVPLVVYSAEELTRAERDRLALGPTEFFTKGRITPEDFEQRVIALLNRIVTQPESD